MATTTSDHRKFKCLVATFLKEGIDSIEKAQASTGMAKSFDLSDIIRAIDAVKKTNAKTWHKPIDKILAGADRWNTVEEPWVSFDEMREKIESPKKEIVYRFAYMVWSPVEVWIVAKKSNDAVFYIESMLTGETWYVMRKIEDHTLAYYNIAIDPRNHPNIPNTLNVTRGAFASYEEMKRTLIREGARTGPMINAIVSKIMS